MSATFRNACDAICIPSAKLLGGCSSACMMTTGLAMPETTLSTTKVPPLDLDRNPGKRRSPGTDRIR
eukprot:13448308-Heterocapsa_arctica.AAC.1